MRFIPVLLLLLLTSCPAGDPGDGNQGTRGSTETSSQDPGPPYEIPEDAMAFFQASLGDPAVDGHAPLGPAWLAIARLPGRQGLEPLADLITVALDRAGDSPLPELVAAWLKVDEAAAVDFIVNSLRDNNTSYLPSLTYAPDSGRKVLNAIDPTLLDEDALSYVFVLYKQWNDAGPEDAPLFTLIAGQHASPVAVVADGYLDKLGYGSDGSHQRVVDALDSKALSEYVPAIEAVVVSGDGSYADELIPIIARAETGDEDEESNSEPLTAYAAYALAFLPGSQADFMRTKMLTVRDPLIRWQARLGDLLHDDPSSWRIGLRQHGIESYNLWVVLEPANVVHEGLLETYEQAARSDEVPTRSRAAVHLNRYRQSASKIKAAGINAGLIADENAQVRELAWYTAGGLGMAFDPLPVVNDADEDPLVRLAAAYCAACLAQRGIEPLELIK